MRIDILITLTSYCHKNQKMYSMVTKKPLHMDLSLTVIQLLFFLLDLNITLSKYSDNGGQTVKTFTF